jgi:quercetin dioxygenase-like cupin family protein
MIGTSASSWDFWERHPAGEELVVVIEGSATLVQEIEGEEQRVTLVAGQGAINPTGVWHSADVTEPARILFVTPGLGTEHRSRQ